MGAYAPQFACVCISSGPLHVLFFTHTFWRLRRLSGPCMCGYTSCSSCAPGFVVCVFVVAVVCSLAACGSLLSVPCGCPSYNASFCAGGLEYREYRMHTWAVGRRRGARGVGLFGGGLLIPWRACGGSHVRVRAWAYLLCVFHGVSWSPCFFVWRFAFGGSPPLDASTHLDLACLMASSSYACGEC